MGCHVQNRSFLLRLLEVKISQRWQHIQVPWFQPISKVRGCSKQPSIKLFFIESQLCFHERQQGWNSCLLAGTRTGGGCKASFQPLPSLTCPQWASRGCLKNINLNTCSRLLPVPKTAVKSEWGCKLWAPAGFRRRKAHRPLWEVPLSPGCRIQRVIQVQQLWGVRPCVSDPNLQTFGSLQHLEYTWPLVGIDILVNSSAWWWNTNIWLAIAGSGELLAYEYVLLTVFKDTKDYLTGGRTIFL